MSEITKYSSGLRASTSPSGITPPRNTASPFRGSLGSSGSASSLSEADASSFAATATTQQMKGVAGNANSIISLHNEINRLSEELRLRTEDLAELRRRAKLTRESEVEKLLAKVDEQDRQIHSLYTQLRKHTPDEAKIRQEVWEYQQSVVQGRSDDRQQLTKLEQELAKAKREAERNLRFDEGLRDEVEELKGKLEVANIKLQEFREVGKFTSSEVQALERQNIENKSSADKEYEKLAGSAQRDRSEIQSRWTASEQELTRLHEELEKLHAERRAESLNAQQMTQKWMLQDAEAQALIKKLKQKIQELEGRLDVTREVAMNDQTSLIETNAATANRLKEQLDLKEAELADANGEIRRWNAKYNDAQARWDGELATSNADAAALRDLIAKLEAELEQQKTSYDQLTIQLTETKVSFEGQLKQNASTIENEAEKWLILGGERDKLKAAVDKAFQLITDCQRAFEEKDGQIEDLSTISDMLKRELATLRPLHSDLKTQRQMTAEVEVDAAEKLTAAEFEMHEKADYYVGQIKQRDLEIEELSQKLKDVDELRAALASLQEAHEQMAVQFELTLVQKEELAERLKQHQMDLEGKLKQYGNQNEMARLAAGLQRLEVALAEKSRDLADAEASRDRLLLHLKQLEVNLEHKTLEQIQADLHAASLEEWNRNATAQNIALEAQNQHGTQALLQDINAKDRHILSLSQSIEAQQLQLEANHLQVQQLQQGQQQQQQMQQHIETQQRQLEANNAQAQQFQSKIQELQSKNEQLQRQPPQVIQQPVAAAVQSVVQQQPVQIVAAPQHMVTAPFQQPVNVQYVPAPAPTTLYEKPQQQPQQQPHVNAQVLYTPPQNALQPPTQQPQRLTYLR